MTRAVAVGAGFVLGIWLSRGWHESDWLAALLALIVLAAYLLARSFGMRASVPALLAAAVLLGLARGGPELLTPHGNLHLFHGRTVEVSGMVSGTPAAVDNRIRVMVDADSVTVQSVARPASGRILMWVEPIPWIEGRAPPYLERGDRLIVSGRLDSPEAFGAFDYPAHLAAQDIGAVMNAGYVANQALHDAQGPSLQMLDRIRVRLADNVRRVLPEPAASLTIAMSLGVHGGPSPEVSDALRRAGLTHVLAISGLHVGLVLALTMGAVAAIWGRRQRLLLFASLSMVWAYVLLAGAAPSAVWAGVLGSAGLVAYGTGRASRAAVGLGLAAALIVALQPEQLWHRSFQLSLTAMAGVLLIGGPLWQRLSKRLAPEQSAGMPLLRRLARWAVAGSAVSLGATLGTLPLVAYSFGELSVLASLTTFIVIPVLPLIIAGGIVTGMLAAVWTPLAWVVGWAPALGGAYVAAVGTLVGQLPFAVIEAAPEDSALLGGYYAVLGFVLALMHRQRWQPPLALGLRWVWDGPATGYRSALFIGVLALLATSPWAYAATRACWR